MRMYFTSLLAVLFLSSGCGHAQEFGAKFDETSGVRVDRLMEKLDAGSQPGMITLQGTVEDVCQVKGCWLTLKAENGESMRVTFKDYGFFVPKDISGRTVLLKGVGEIVVTSVDDLRHYAEDEGKSKEEIEKITEPASEYTFVADGVKLLD